MSSSEVSELYNIYFNTHYKDLTLLSVDESGSHQGGSYLTEDRMGETPLYYRSPIYDFSLMATSSTSGTGYLSAGFFFGNGVTGSVSNYHDVQTLGSTSQLIKYCYNTSLSHSSAEIDAHVQNLAQGGIGGSYAQLVPISDRVMNETGSIFPTGRAMDFEVRPPLGLNVPGPGRLRGRTTPYKVTKK